MSRHFSVRRSNNGVLAMVLSAHVPWICVAVAGCGTAPQTQMTPCPIVEVATTAPDAPNSPFELIAAFYADVVPELLTFQELECNRCDDVSRSDVGAIVETVEDIAAMHERLVEVSLELTDSSSVVGGLITLVWEAGSSLDEALSRTSRDSGFDEDTIDELQDLQAFARGTYGTLRELLTRLERTSPDAGQRVACLLARMVAVEDWISYRSQTITGLRLTSEWTGQLETEESELDNARYARELRQEMALIDATITTLAQVDAPLEALVRDLQSHLRLQRQEALWDLSSTIATRDSCGENEAGSAGNRRHEDDGDDDHPGR